MSSSSSQWFDVFLLFSVIGFSLDCNAWLFTASGRAQEDDWVIREPSRDEPLFAITLAPIKDREAIFEKISWARAM